jgi:hypothetical protein
MWRAPGILIIPWYVLCMAGQRIVLLPLIPHPVVLFPGGQVELSESEHEPLNTIAAHTCALVPEGALDCGVASIAQVTGPPHHYIGTGRLKILQVFSAFPGQNVIIGQALKDEPPSPTARLLARQVVAVLGQLSTYLHSPLELSTISRLGPSALSFLIASSRLVDCSEQIQCLSMVRCEDRLQLLLQVCYRHVHAARGQFPWARSERHLFN